MEAHIHLVLEEGEIPVILPRHLEYHIKHRASEGLRLFAAMGSHNSYIGPLHQCAFASLRFRRGVSADTSSRTLRRSGYTGCQTPPNRSAMPLLGPCICHELPC